MNHIDLLKAARQILTRTEAWTIESSARDKDGAFVSPESDQAVCFCSYGALSRASHRMRPTGDLTDWNYAVFEAEEALRRTLERRDLSNYIATFNDTHSHADVLGLFDETIAYEEKARGK